MKKEIRKIEKREVSHSCKSENKCAVKPTRLEFDNSRALLQLVGSLNRTFLPCDLDAIKSMVLNPPKGATMKQAEESFMELPTGNAVVRSLNFGVAKRVVRLTDFDFDVLEDVEESAEVVSDITLTFVKL